MADQPVLGVIGGSGLYHMSGLIDPQSIEIDTPFGSPSAPLVIGTLEGKRVAFLARHGIGHHISPSEVNYRANIYAMKKLGVKKVVSISACGSLREDYAPGHIVVPDQIFDFTRGTRNRTFFGDGMVAHVSTAEPLCADLSQQVMDALTGAGATAHLGGTFITIEGPRFSTRAESNVFRQWGMSLIGMTASPEAFLAREAELCYAVMAHVTDYDVWHESEEPVTVEKVIQTLLHNADVAKHAVANAIQLLADAPPSPQADALHDAIITNKKLVPPEVVEHLKLIVWRYFSA